MYFFESSGGSRILKGGFHGGSPRKVGGGRGLKESGCKVVRHA